MKDLQPNKQCTHTEVSVARDDVIPNIELDDSEREVLVDSTKIAISFVKT